MKTTLRLLSIFILFALYTIGCTKSPGDNNTVLNPPPAAGPGTTLAAVYAIDTTLAVPHDTIGSYKVVYDALNRTSVIVEMDYKPNGDTAYYKIQTLTYNGTDTNAARKVKYSKSFSSATPSIYRDTSFYIFTNGKCVYDSNASSTGYVVTKYSYTGNTVLRNGISRANSIQSELKSTIYQTMVNGNISFQIDTAVSHVSTVVNPAFFSYQRMEITTSYTANPNPFHQVIKSFLRPYMYDDSGIGSAAAPKNLITQQHSSLQIWGNGASGNNIHDLNYNYVFRADGYPLIARQTIIGSGGTTTKLKLVFIYQ